MRAKFSQPISSDSLACFKQFEKKEKDTEKKQENENNSS